MLAVAAFIQEEDDMAEQRMEQLHMKQFLRDASNPFVMGDHVFKKNYRMYPWIAIALIEELRPYLTDHPRGVPPHLQVLAIVRFLAEGAYQKGIAQDLYHPMSQSTFSKYLHKVVPAINHLADRYIVFPRNREERQEISRRFEGSIGFLGVLGAIDCTLPKIHTPADHEEAYLNRHQDHSMNVQVVSDMDYNIMNVRICNGSTNDQFIWAHSQMRQTMHDLRNDQDILENEGRYYLIGDSGYTPSKILLTPVLDAPPDGPEFRYSDRLRRTRCRIEQTFGVWKEVCRCLNGDRSLHYAPAFASQIISSSAVLYNFMRHHGMPAPVPPRHRERRIRNDDVINDEYIEGLQERQAIINRYFV